MRTVIAGGGPVGTFTALMLARRGHDVTLVDRDPGPGKEGEWRRVGVMQFLHPHGWRPQVVAALQAELPDVLESLLAAGAHLESLPGHPELAGISCRRSTFERVLRDAARHQPGLHWLTGHVDEITVSDGRATGIVVDGASVSADVVVVATGRNTGLGDEFRGPTEGGPCGFSYVTRVLRAQPGEQPYTGLPRMQTGPGYLSVVMGGDNDTHTVVIACPSHDPLFAALRTTPQFEHIVARIPNLAPWTDPARFDPMTEALVGGHLTNTYRRQGPTLGLPPATGLYFLGDSVLTTNPAAGRNLALLLPHAQHFVAALDAPGADLDDVSLDLDDHGERCLRPWYLDHADWDRTLLRRFAGQDLNLDEPLPSDVICAAFHDEPSVRPFVGRYLAMAGGPEILRPAEPAVRALLATGWRPRPVGPSAAELTLALRT